MTNNWDEIMEQAKPAPPTNEQLMQQARDGVAFFPDPMVTPDARSAQYAAVQAKALIVIASELHQIRRILEAEE